MKTPIPSPLIATVKTTVSGKLETVAVIEADNFIDLECRISEATIQLVPYVITLNRGNVPDFFMYPTSFDTMQYFGNRRPITTRLVA